MEKKNLRQSSQKSIKSERYFSRKSSKIPSIPIISAIKKGGKNLKKQNSQRDYKSPNSPIFDFKKKLNAKKVLKFEDDVKKEEEIENLISDDLKTHLKQMMKLIRIVELLKT